MNNLANRKIKLPFFSFPCSWSDYLLIWSTERQPCSHCSADSWWCPAWLARLVYLSFSSLRLLLDIFFLNLECAAFAVSSLFVWFSPIRVVFFFYHCVYPVPCVNMDFNLSWLACFHNWTHFLTSGKWQLNRFSIYVIPPQVQVVFLCYSIKETVPENKIYVDDTKNRYENVFLSLSKLSI